MPTPLHSARKRIRSWFLGAGAAIVAALWALCLVPSPANAATQITVTGVVHCHGGATEGVWIVSSGGGSGWASVHSFKTGKDDGSSADVRYGRTFTTNLPSTISLHVGCGGSPGSWKTVNASRVSFSVTTSRTLNAFCGNGAASGPCDWPLKGKTATAQASGTAKQCTEGALRSMHAYDGFWGGWWGNAAQWASTAASTVPPWTVTTVPMPDSIVVQPGTNGNSFGHVAWVMHLNTNAAGTVTGLHVYEENYDGTGTNPTGHTREANYPLNSAWRYIVAPSPH